MAFCYMIGIAGDSMSGKSMLTDALAVSYSHRTVIVLQMDSYRKPDADLPTVTLADGRCVADRHSPEAFDLQRMREDIFNIIEEQRCRILIVEGPYTFSYKAIEELCDIRVYVDCPEEVLSQRRSSTKAADPAYEEHICDCCTKYIEPSREEADLIVSSTVSIEQEVWHIRKTLRGLFL